MDSFRVVDHILLHLLYILKWNWVGSACLMNGSMFRIACVVLFGRMRVRTEDKFVVIFCSEIFFFLFKKKFVMLMNLEHILDVLLVNDNKKHDSEWKRN